MFKLKIIIFLVMLITFIGCKSSYPISELKEKTQAQIKKEVGYETTVFLKGKTLYVLSSDFKNQLNSSLAVSNKVFTAIQNIVLIATNVALSTDADIQFYSIIILDPTSRVQIVFKQYVEDVKKWFYGLISRDDFFSRSLTEINNLSYKYVLDEKNFKDISMPEFILEQTISRMKNALKIESDELEKKEKNNIKSLLEINKKLKDNKFFDIYLTNALISKKYIKSSDNKYYFEYTFKNIDYSNFFKINYKEFGAALVKQHMDVCNIYKFSKYKGILIKENNKILYSNIKLSAIK